MSENKASKETKSSENYTVNQSHEVENLKNIENGSHLFDIKIKTYANMKCLNADVVTQQSTVWGASTAFKLTQRAKQSRTAI